MIPRVYGMITLRQAAEKALSYDSAVWCYEKGGMQFAAAGLKSGTEIALIIGSEGGFSDGEAEKMKELGLQPVSLGSRILRCETAPLAAASIIMNLTGNM